MKLIKSIYRSNPKFINDILHLHFFKTVIYFEERMNDFPSLKISGDLKLGLFRVEYATNYSVENGTYNFKIKSDILGMPDAVPFPLLFNTMIKVCYSAADIEEMYNSLYDSQNPILLKLAEQFKDRDISINSELFDFVKRKECDPRDHWQLNDFLSGSWNFILLALNNSVWKSAFDKNYLSEIFQDDKRELDKIDEGDLFRDDYLDYLRRIDLLIKSKFH